MKGYNHSATKSFNYFFVSNTYACCILKIIDAPDPEGISFDDHYCGERA